MPAKNATVPKLLYRIPEAAQAMGISTDSVQKLIQSGQLRSSKLMGMRVIHHEDLTAFVDGLRKPKDTRPQFVLDLIESERKHFSGRKA